MGEKADYSREILEYCKRVDKRFKLKEAIFFGSRSRGDDYPSSDIDILLISDDFPDDWFERQAQLYFLKAKKIEPIGYTTREIKEMKENGNQFIKQVMREGKMIDFTISSEQ